MVNECCKVVLAVICPPFGVCAETGCCTCDVLINVCLTCLGYIPGIIHALYVIFGKGENRHNHKPQHGQYA